jgi:integrase
MFVWGIEYEIVTQEVVGALKLVKSVHRKQADDNPPREDVPDEVIKRTLPFLSPTIADMVRIQRLAAMRPGDVCKMKVGEIDQSGEVWIYRPPEHKTTWRGHKRTIFLGKPEQEILERRMAGKERGQYVFNPREAMREHWERAAAKRKTKVQPSQQERKEKRAKNPKRKYREDYTPGVYGKAIKKAIRSANRQLPSDQQIPHWFPYLLKHTATTKTTETEGLDVARAIAGQKSLGVAMIYNHADDTLAFNSAKKRTNPFE